MHLHDLLQHQHVTGRLLTKLPAYVTLSYLWYFKSVSVVDILCQYHRVKRVFTFLLYGQYSVTVINITMLQWNKLDNFTNY